MTKEVISELRDIAVGLATQSPPQEGSAARLRNLADSLERSDVGIRERRLRSAMRLLATTPITQYLLANTRARSNGAAKAEFHSELTKIFVAVARDCDKDRVRQRYKIDYHSVHDATAEELTNRLDEAIGFDLDGYISDELVEAFFLRFYEIAMATLSPGSKSRSGEVGRFSGVDRYADMEILDGFVDIKDGT